MGAAIPAAGRERYGLHSSHPARFRLGGLRPLSMGAAVQAAGRACCGLHSSHPDRFRLGGLRPLIEAPPSGPPVGSATGSTLSILPVFAWAGSARSSKRRHPGGRSGARDTATQRRRDAHRPALKRGVARAPRAGVGCERSHGWRSEAGFERTEATMAEVSVRRRGMGDPEASRLSQAPDVTRAAMSLSKEPKG